MFTCEKLIESQIQSIPVKGNSDNRNFPDKGNDSFKIRTKRKNFGFTQFSVKRNDEKIAFIRVLLYLQIL